MKASAETRRISVGGGKGGVGKSLLAANVATTLARLGRSVTLVDADIGAANLHTLLGVERVAPTLRQFLSGEIDSLDEARSATPIDNLRLVCGVGAVPGATDLGTHNRRRLLEGIAAIGDEVVVVDVGAGSHNLVVDLWLAADLRLLVMAPQLTAVQNGFAFLKAAIHRALVGWADTAEERSLVAELASAPEAQRLGEWVSRGFAADPLFVERVMRGLDHFGARIVGNQLFDEEDAGMLQAFSRMARDLLRVEAPLIGAICASRAIHDSVNARRPAVLDDEELSEQVADLCVTLLTEDLDPLRAARAAGSAAPLPEDAGDEDFTGTGGDLPRSFLRFYVRRHRRFAVDWLGELTAPSGTAPVRVREVSLGGAMIQYTQPLAVGDLAELALDELPDRPLLPVEVRHVQEGDGLAGVQFRVEGELPARLIDWATKRKRRSIRIAKPLD